MSICYKFNNFFDDLSIFIDELQNFYSHFFTPQMLNFVSIKKMMLKRDKIKLVVVSILLVMIASSYIVFGKESMVMKSVAGFSLVFWIITMIYLNRKYK